VYRPTSRQDVLAETEQVTGWHVSLLELPYEIPPQRLLNLEQIFATWRSTLVTHWL